MNSARRFARAATLAALAVCLPGTAARAEDYPRLGLYGTIAGNGHPFWDPNGVLQDTTLDAVGRYHEVILEANAPTPSRADALAALRARRPNIKLFAYVLGHYIWDANQADSLVDYPTRYNHLVRDLGGWLYNDAGDYFSATNVNLAKRDRLGRFIVAEGLADLFNDAIVSTGLWDGIFFDIYCGSIKWMESPTEHIDYVRAGYPTFAAFDAAWAAGIDTLGNRLRRLAGGSFEMIGNCTPTGNYAAFNGWMRENFPYQGGGDWYQNMFRVAGGYFSDEERYRVPRSNYIFSALVGTDPYLPTNTRKVRFGLGSAALGSGYGVFGPSDRSALYPFHMWWYDEYAVDLSTGRASPSLQHTGWLGQPLGPYGQMIWLGPGPDVVSNPDFETDVTSGWTFGTGGVPATLARDGATAAVGSASAKVSVSAIGAVPWLVAFNTVNTMALGAWQPYSATFWAKASVPRTIVVACQAASQRVSLTTAWRRYQVTLIPYASNTGGLQLFFAEAVGDVWLDDVHFQAGVTNLYRRDFQNGIVLVNPAPNAMTVPLEREFKKILGTRDPVTNDGAIVTQVTVNPSDALFLIGDDQIPPSSVMDLQPGPAWTPRLTRSRPPSAPEGEPRRP